MTAIHPDAAGATNTTAGATAGATAADTPPRPGRVAVIVPAAGRGERLGPGAPKALRELGGVPLLVHAVRSLLAARSVDLVCVAAPPSAEGVAEVRALLDDESGKDTGKNSGSGKDILVTAGGASRQGSVASALAILPADCTVVLVHDAARALAPVELIESVVAAVRSGRSAVVPVLPVADTVKRVDGDLVTATIDRSLLRVVQTPQGFTRPVLEQAHANADPTAPATDDAGLVEALGLPVHTVPGHPAAFKVTTPFDLLVAEAVLARSRQSQSRPGRSSAHGR